MSKTVFFDVDDTLIFWKGGQIFTSEAKEFLATITIAGIRYKIHQPMIDQLKRHSVIGDYIIVWSAGGDAWAKLVVKELELTHFVDVVIPKPDFMYDDNKNPLCHSSRMYVGLKR